MRFSTTSALLALPLLGMAAEDGGLFGQYRAQFQNLLGSFGIAQPDAGAGEPAAAGGAHAAGGAASATGTKAAGVAIPLTLGNWHNTLYSTVKAGATTPEEWRVLITGSNKTCFGTFPYFSFNFLL